MTASGWTKSYSSIRGMKTSSGASRLELLDDVGSEESRPARHTHPPVTPETTSALVHAFHLSAWLVNSASLAAPCAREGEASAPTSGTGPLPEPIKPMVRPRISTMATFAPGSVAT